MQRGGAAKRYAQAVFELARESDSLDAWQRDLDVMAQLVTDEQGRQLFESPRVDEARKRQVAERLLAGRVQPLALNLARLLIERGRFTFADRIASLYTDLVREHRGVAVAEVTTAVPLDAAAQQEVAARLGAVVGKRVEILQQVDPAIIGGIVARVGDYLIDGSVTGRLNRLKARLAQ